MKDKIKEYRKRFYNGGFTLVELLAVIVILAIIMLITIPAVLSVVETSRKKTFIVYTNRMVVKSEERLSKDQIESNEIDTCIIYDIKKDFDLSTTGEFNGWILLNNNTGDKYITIYNNDFALVGYHYIGNDEDIQTKLVRKTSEIENNLSIEKLCELSNCLTCSSKTDEGSATEIKPANRIALLKPSSEIRKITKGFTDAPASGDTVTKKIVITNSIEDKTNNISDENSFYDIYTWYKDNILYIGCEANEIYLNKDSKRLFGDFKAIESIEGFNKINSSLMNNAEYFFYNDKSLVNIDLSNFDTSNCKRFFCMFMYCSSLINLDLSNFDTSKVESMDKMFCECSKLKSVNISSFNTKKCHYFSSMFNGCEALESIDIRHFKCDELFGINAMFKNCESLKTIDVSNLDTKYVEDYRLMFSGCKSLETLDLSNFDTYLGENMSSMFNGCTNLKSLNISNFDTTNVTDMSWMFSELPNLKNLDLTHFKTKKVKKFYGMFQKSNFDSLNLTKFDTAKAEDMRYMFSKTNIDVLDLSSFVISENCDLNSMFESSTVKTIYTSSNWSDVSGVTGSFTFNKCYNLKGAVSFSSSKRDYTMANYNNGYFTYKAKA